MAAGGRSLGLPCGFRSEGGAQQGWPVRPFVSPFGSRRRVFRRLLSGAGRCPGGSARAPGASAFSRWAGRPGLDVERKAGGREVAVRVSVREAARGERPGRGRPPTTGLRRDGARRQGWAE